MAKVDPAQLSKLRGAVKAELDGLPKLSYEKRDQYDRAEKAMLKRLEDGHGAKVDRRYDGTRVRMAGVTAHSTTGLVGALRNWIAGAERALDRQSWLAK